MSLLLLERSETTAVVTLNRPDAMNALTKPLQAELADLFEALAKDEDVRVIVLTGAGDRAFCAGLDLAELSQIGLPMGPDGLRGKDPVQFIERCRKPIIGAINGVAITGGFELALCCDILIASTRARFADTHARVGITPYWGLSQKLSRVIGIYRAKELSLSGNFLDAATALHWGLVNRVVEPQELLPAAMKLAADIASCDPDMVPRYKALIDEGFGKPFAEALRFEKQCALTGNANIDAAAIAKRRAAVQSRGRDQRGS